MSEYLAIEYLFEKHAPKPRPQLPTGDEIRLAIIKDGLARTRSKPAPDDVIRTLHREYQKLGGVRPVAKKYGLQRTSVRNMFKRAKLPVVQPNAQPTITRNGIKYSLNPDGQCWRRTTRGQQKHTLHRDIWEEKHGPIPPGMCVVARDGDNSQVRLENLFLLSKPDAMRYMCALRLKKTTSG
jgi:hypothetical protein